MTGYILYSSDVRRNVTASNPDCNFGEVSRIVGNEVSSVVGCLKLGTQDPI